jgi:ABC-2 type transport system permease protein
MTIPANASRTSAQATRSFLTKVFWVGRTSARSNIAYFGEVTSRVIFLGVILFVFLQLWRTTYSEMGATELGGLTLAQMLWYLAFTEALVMSAPSIAIVVDSDVRTGVISVQLLRPMYYPLMRLVISLGEQLIRYTLNITVGVVIVLLFVGGIPVGVDNVLQWLIVLPFAFVLYLLMFLVIGLGAFWLEDTSGLRLIYSRIAMILGGTLLPLSIFPDALQPILRALPFSSIIYAPARLFVQPDWSYFFGTLALQAFWIVVFSALVVLVFRVAVKRINANGG